MMDGIEWDRIECNKIQGKNLRLYLGSGRGHKIVNLRIITWVSALKIQQNL